MKQKEEEEIEKSGGRRLYVDGSSMYDTGIVESIGPT